MDCVTSAIEKKMHKCGDRTIENQTWMQFKEQAKKKEVYIFGAGSGLDYFFQYCYDCMPIKGIVDNDCNKQGHKLIWHCTEAWGTSYENIEIQKPDVLTNSINQNVVVLIVSTNYYKEIIEQLSQMGIRNCYVLLMLEANKRKTQLFIEKDTKKEIDNFIKKCLDLDVEENKIVMSIGEYGGHAKCITNHLLNLRNDLDIVWLVYEEDQEAPIGVRLVPEQNWKSYTYELETAKIWLFDITVENYIVKRKGQIYIQTKHWSSITLKKFYLDDKSSCTSPKIEAWIQHNGEMMDYLLSGSKFDEQSCESGFGFKGKAVRVGSARSDILFDKTIRNKIYHYFHIELDANTLLYAPTYRNNDYLNNKGMNIIMDIKLLRETLTYKFGGKWYILIRLHPRTDDKKCEWENFEGVINVSRYPDSEELVAASDIMVTDYSSIMFEAAYVKRPVFLFAPDKKEYIDGERGLLLDYDTLPFPIAESNKALMRCIVEFDAKRYKKAVTKFLEHYEVYEDGHASKRAADFILRVLSTEKEI